MNKKQTMVYENYMNSMDYDLLDAYTTCSCAKHRAWEYCRELQQEKNGAGLKVISHNTFMFTAGFTFEEDGTEKFMYITPSKDEVFEIA